MKEVTLDELKQLLVANCMLRVAPEEIKGDTPLFGPDSLGLDSIDALQMTVAIENSYGIVIKDPETARQAFQSLNHLRDWLCAERDKNSTAI
jgi:acyl carrier protein